MNFVSGVLQGGETLAGAGVFSAAGVKVPPGIDCRREMIPASNQGATSECVCYTWTAAIEYWRWKMHGKVEQINPHPAYVRAKELDGAPTQDGTTLAAGFEACIDLGLMTRPRDKDVRVFHDPSFVARAIHRFGVVPVILRITDGWSSAARSGWIEDGQPFIGYHAVPMCAYSHEGEKWYAVQNSWSANHGWRGFVRLTPEEMKREFVTGIAADLGESV